MMVGSYAKPLVGMFAVTPSAPNLQSFVYIFSFPLVVANSMNQGAVNLMLSDFGMKILTILIIEVLEIVLKPLDNTILPTISLWHYRITFSSIHPSFDQQSYPIT